MSNDQSKIISEDEFVSVAEQEQCRARLDEIADAAAPFYRHYSSSAQELLRRKIYPPWRVNQDGTQCILAFEVPRGEAFPISYANLSTKQNLFNAIKFDTNRNYFDTSRVITFHCASCGIHVVKDGNHRLLQCTFHKLERRVEVYEVVSYDWSACRVDMKNFCECIRSAALQGTQLTPRA